MSPKPPKKKLTVKSVASILGVSTATVSNAFNRPDQLSSVLRNKILDECERIGYHGPNPAARSLRTGSTGVVGIMLAEKLAYNFSDPCAIEFLEGVSQILDDARVNMLLMPGREEFYKKTSLESIPDRYIIYGPPKDLPLLDRIERQHKPIISVDFNLENHLSLNIDNYGGAKAAANHVFETTSGPVAVIGLRLSKDADGERINATDLYDPNYSISRQRLNAYLDASKEANRPIGFDYIWDTSKSSWDEGVKAARSALSVSPRPTALLCMSDNLALAALSVAREMGLHVPQELSIVGFDDTPAASVNHPEVTTVYQPSLEKGRLAAKMVLNPENYDSIVLPTELKIRETS